MENNPRFMFYGMGEKNVQSLINDLCDNTKKNAAEALIGIIYTQQVGDWSACREAMEVYFWYQNPAEIEKEDFSDFDHSALKTWFEAFVYTRMWNEPEGSSARILFLRVVNELINKSLLYVVDEPIIWN